MTSLLLVAKSRDNTIVHPPSTVIGDRHNLFDEWLIIIIFLCHALIGLYVKLIVEKVFT